MTNPIVRDRNDIIVRFVRVCTATAEPTYRITVEMHGETVETHAIPLDSIRRHSQHYMRNVLPHAKSGEGYAIAFRIDNKSLRTLLDAAESAEMDRLIAAYVDPRAAEKAAATARILAHREHADLYHEGDTGMRSPHA